MSRFYHRGAGKIGLPPGTLIHIGEKRTDRTRITLMDYSRDHLTEKTVDTIETVFPLKNDAARAKRFR